MLSHLRVVCVATILTAVAPTPAIAALTRAAMDAVDAAVTAELQRQQVVGAAIGVIKDGRIVYIQGYGFADRDNGTPVDGTTVFNWASNSKPLAAVMAMQLAQSKLLDLDADVRTYVPEFPDKGAKITTRHLLCHQSGIPHYSNGTIIPGLHNGDGRSSLVNPFNSLNRFSRSPLLFDPGSRVSYSTYAYILLSTVIERAGGEPFESQIRSRIAKRAGMKSLELDSVSQGHENWAVGYVKNGAGEIVEASEEANEWKYGAGGIKSNIDDFTRWALALVNHRLVSRSIEEQMYAPQSLSDGTMTTWGLGFSLAQQNGLKISHNGRQDEATTRLVIYMRSRQAVVVMTNCRYATVGRISTAVFKSLNN